MSVLKLQLSVAGTLAFLIALSTLFFTVILNLMGITSLVASFFIVLFNIIQWLIAPYLIGAMYRTKEFEVWQPQTAQYS